MGKKSKSSKGKASSTAGSTAGTTRSSGGGSSGPQPRRSTQQALSRDDAASFHSHLDKDKLCAQFDALIESIQWVPVNSQEEEEDCDSTNKKSDDKHSKKKSPEEGIQAVRDLYLNVLKKRLTSQKRVQFLQKKKASLRSDVSRCHELISEETSAYVKANAQKDKLQSLSDQLNEKKEKLLLETKVRTESEKAKQQQRTSDLIGETQEISAKLEKYDRMRQQYVEENARLKDKLRVVLDKYSTQEKDFNTSMERQVELITAASQQLGGQSERLEKEVQGREDLDQRLAEVLAAEEVLRKETKEKAGRFEEFQDALTKSNEAFKGLKVRMEEQSATIASLENENKQLSAKKDKTEQTIKDLSAEIVASRQAAFDTTQKQIEKLTSLCAAMKAEIEELTGSLEEEA